MENNEGWVPVESPESAAESDEVKIQKIVLMDFLMWIRENNETFDIAYKDEPIDTDTLYEQVDGFMASLDEARKEVF